MMSITSLSTDIFDNGTNITTLNEKATINLPEYTAIISLVLCCLILAVGVLGNLLVLVVILTSKVLRSSSTNLFLLSLSAADLLVLIICTPTTLVEIITRKDEWILGMAMCYLVTFMELYVSHASVLTILAITVERYYAICLPLQAGSVWTKSKACITCIFAWIVAFGLTAPVTAMVEYSYSPESTVCLTSVKTFWPKFYFIFIITVFFFIPLVILVLLYRHIVRHLVPPDDEQVLSESAAVLRSRRQVVTMLVAVVFFFFACIMPFRVLTLWIVTLPTDIGQVISNETYYNLLYFARIMFYINSAINPILYNIMSSKFRNGFKRVFYCVKWTESSRFNRPRQCSMVVMANCETHGNFGSISSACKQGRKFCASGTSAASVPTDLENQRIFNNAFGSSGKHRNLRTSSFATFHSLQVGKSGKFESEVLDEDEVRVGFGKSESAHYTSKKEYMNSERNDQMDSDVEEENSSYKHSSSHSRNSRGNRHSHNWHESTKSDQQNNIVFIEERKILLIPTSTSSN